ncbi:hypothetical protein C8J57DRAFT_1329021 [Mycena rebaudengoi]|nr:hypothetical protein C8J57DRAFT_1329021 [Mycena rebaudengoi]
MLLFSFAALLSHSIPLPIYVPARPSSLLACAWGFWLYAAAALASTTVMAALVFGLWIYGPRAPATPVFHDSVSHRAISHPMPERAHGGFIEPADVLPAQCPAVGMSVGRAHIAWKMRTVVLITFVEGERAREGFLSGRMSCLRAVGRTAFLITLVLGTTLASVLSVQLSPHLHFYTY